VRKLIRRWLPAVIWMGLIFFVSAQPTLPSVPGRWDLLLKKGMHMAAYGILTALYLRALRGSGHDEWVIRAASVALAVAYAMSDEYHQTFVPGRNGTWVDVAVDGVGILGATGLDWWLGSRGWLEASQVSG
jgi:VanZ family protein